jgi:hypothetical protein
MDRKALFLVLAFGSLLLGAIAFFALPAHNWTNTLTFIDGSTTSYHHTCDTMDREDECSSQFYTRVGAAAIGVVGAGVFLVLSGAMASAPSRPVSVAAARGSHDVRYDPSKNLYWCAEQGCTFESPAKAVARSHRLETGATATTPSAAPKPSGFELPVKTAPPANPATPPTQDSPPASEYKTCPDCAEDVRAAARKCRFCGYMFEGSTLAESAS